MWSSVLWLVGYLHNSTATAILHKFILWVTKMKKKKEKHVKRRAKTDENKLLLDWRYWNSRHSRYLWYSIRYDIIFRLYIPVGSAEVDTFRIMVLNNLNGIWCCCCVVVARFELNQYDLNWRFFKFFISLLWYVC